MQDGKIFQIFLLLLCWASSASPCAGCTSLAGDAFNFLAELTRAGKMKPCKAPASSSAFHSSTGKTLSPLPTSTQRDGCSQASTPQPNLGAQHHAPPCSPRGSRALPRGRVVREGTPVLSRGFAHTPTFLEPPDSLWGPRHPCAAHGGHLAAGEPCHGDAALLEKMLALPWRCSPSPSRPPGARPSPAPSPCFPSSHTNPSPGGSLGAIGAPISRLGGYCTSQLGGPLH